MRIKALTKYNFSTTRLAIIIFMAFFMAGTLLGTVSAYIAEGNVVIMGVSGQEEGVSRSWSSSIFAFSIFMVVSSLISSQRDTRFLITRSVSRKEIFTANAAFLLPLAGIMSALQITSIYIDSLVRRILGMGWRGLALDIQVQQAPDMNNIFVFFVVSLSILCSFGALSYLLGSLLARWKIQTIAVLSIMFISFLSLAISLNLFMKIFNAFMFMFTDDNTGLIIALKQIIFAALAMAVSFPVMRKITAAKQ